MRVFFKRWDALIVMVIILTMYFLSVNAVYYTSYTMGAIELARNIPSGRFDVNPQLCNYADYIVRDSKCFFVAPLGLALVLIPSVKLAEILKGSDLVFAGFTMAFFGVLTFYIALKLYDTLFEDRRKSLILALTSGLAGPLYIYSTHIFPQAPLAFFYTLFVLSALKICLGGGFEWAFIAGFSASMAVLLDPSTFISIVTLCLITLAKLVLTSKALEEGLQRVLINITLFIVSFLPMLSLLLYYNVVVTGSIFVFPEQLYLERIGVRGFDIAYTPQGLFTLLVDIRKGLLPLYPIYMLSLAYLPKMLKKLGKYEKTIYLASMITPTLVYASWYDADGGLSYGPRFLVTITPLLIAPLALGLENRAVSRILAILSLYSFAENLIVVISTPYPSSFEDLKPFEIQLITAIGKLLEGDRSAYIYKILSATVGEPIATIVSIAIITTIAATALIVTKEADRQ